MDVRERRALGTDGCPNALGLDAEANASAFPAPLEPRASMEEVAGLQRVARWRGVEEAP